MFFLSYCVSKLPTEFTQKTDIEFSEAAYTKLNRDEKIRLPISHDKRRVVSKVKTIQTETSIEDLSKDELGNIVEYLCDWSDYQSLGLALNAMDRGVKNIWVSIKERATHLNLQSSSTCSKQAYRILSHFKNVQYLTIPIELKQRGFIPMIWFEYVIDQDHLEILKKHPKWFKELVIIEKFTKTDDKCTLRHDINTIKNLWKGKNSPETILYLVKKGNAQSVTNYSSSNLDRLEDLLSKYQKKKTPNDVSNKESQITTTPTLFPSPNDKKHRVCGSFIK